MPHGPESDRFEAITLSIDPEKHEGGLAAFLQALESAMVAKQLEKIRETRSDGQEDIANQVRQRFRSEILGGRIR